MLVGGIDEAGRGPVIGSLVMAGAVIDEEDLPKLKQLGVKDSKLLSAKKREALYDELLKLVTYKVHIITPEQIDAAVLSTTGHNLNWLEADNAAAIINALTLDKVIIDCPSPNRVAYRKYILKRVKTKKIDVVAEHKADRNHVIVGAASIIAKVIRDRELEKLKHLYHVEFGSGYMSDPTTQVFLQKHYKDYPFFRKSWSSWIEQHEKKKQRRLGEY